LLAGSGSGGDVPPDVRRVAEQRTHALVVRNHWRKLTASGEGLGSGEDQLGAAVFRNLFLVAPELKEGGLFANVDTVALRRHVVQALGETISLALHTADDAALRVVLGPAAHAHRAAGVDPGTMRWMGAAVMEAVRAGLGVEALGQAEERAWQWHLQRVLGIAAVPLDDPQL
jgi:hemoglobin-like flavoprotein